MPLVVVDNFLNDSQSNAGSLVFAPAVEPLKHLKNSLGLMRVKPNPIIINFDQVKQPVGIRSD